MYIKTKFIGYMLGFASLLMASQVNAAMISVTPSVTNVNVNVNNPFSLTVQGSDFDVGLADAGLILSWDTASVQMTSTLAEIKTSAFMNGFSDLFNASVLDTVSGTLEMVLSGPFVIDPVDTIGFDGTTFDFFSLNFVAIPLLGTSTIDIGLGATLEWRDGNGDLIPEDSIGFHNATVNVVPVPAAVWLFGSGLLGLVGIARRRNLQLA